MNTDFSSAIAKGLVRERKYPNGLSVFKYSKRVFYDNLWNDDPSLLEARGTVKDSEGNIVILPFTKVFNYGENGTTLPPDTEVFQVVKVNGFMAAARWYNDELLVSTTGSLDSDFAILAKNRIMAVAEGMDDFWKQWAGITFLFEICDESDPHIVEETPGVYLIGARVCKSGHLLSELILDMLAAEVGFMRPEWKVTTFQSVVEDQKTAKDVEGWMVRLLNGQTVMKVKSNFYLTKKFLMRMGDRKVDTLFDDPRAFRATIDEEFYAVCDWITTNFTKTEWKGLGDQQRRKVIEEYFNGGDCG